MGGTIRKTKVHKGTSVLTEFRMVNFHLKYTGHAKVLLTQPLVGERERERGGGVRQAGRDINREADRGAE